MECIGIYNDRPVYCAHQVYRGLAEETPPPQGSITVKYVFYQDGLKPRNVQSGVEPYADENAHKSPHPGALELSAK